MCSCAGITWTYSMPVAAMSWLRSTARGSLWTRILGLRYSGETRQLSQTWTRWSASWGKVSNRLGGGLMVKIQQKKHCCILCFKVTESANINHLLQGPPKIKCSFMRCLFLSSGTITLKKIRCLSVKAVIHLPMERMLSQPVQTWTQLMEHIRLAPWGRDHMEEQTWRF